MNWYFILFGVGIVSIVLSFVVGNFFSAEGVGFSILQPKLVAAFMLVTGGMGLLLTERLGTIGGPGFVLFVSVASGVAAAMILQRFIIVPLTNAQNTSTFDMQATIGVTAEVISKIPQGGYGKIRYNISGSTVTSPAKSEDGNQIIAGEYVEIIYIEKNTYFVRKAEK